MALGGFFEGLVGFSVGEIGITEQVSRQIPVRIAIGTNHAIIAGTASAAALTHLTVVFQGGGSIPWNLLAMTVPAVLIGGQPAGWLAGRVSQDLLRRILAGFLIVLALVTIGRALVSGELSAPIGAVVVATLMVSILVGLFLWQGRQLKAKWCYISDWYYCR